MKTVFHLIVCRGSCIGGKVYLKVKIKKSSDIIFYYVGEIIPMKSKHLKNDRSLTKDKSNVPSEC